MESHDVSRGSFFAIVAYGESPVRWLTYRAFLQIFYGVFIVRLRSARRL